MRCDVLSLDLDGTVIDYSVSTVRALEAIGGRRSDLPQWQKISADSESALEQGRLSIDEFERDRIRTFYDRCVGRQLSETELRNLVAVRHNCVVDCVRLYPDAACLLRSIDVLGLRCVSFSNSFVELRDSVVRRLDLPRHFTDMIFCGNEKFRKPDRRAFAEVQRILGVRPQRIVHIGDEVAADVIGAQNAGWQVAHVNRRGDSCSHNGICIPSLDNSYEKHEAGSTLSFGSKFSLNFRIGSSCQEDTEIPCVALVDDRHGRDHYAPAQRSNSDNGKGVPSEP